MIADENTISKVLKFVKRMEDRDIVFTERAGSAYWTVKNNEKDVTSYVDGLAVALNRFQDALDSKSSLTSMIAGTALLWITRGYVDNLIVEGPGLLNKVQKLGQENSALKAQLDDCTNRLKGLNEEKGFLYSHVEPKDEKP